jgi:hypothetical protein
VTPAFLGFGLGIQPEPIAPQPKLAAGLGQQPTQLEPWFCL